MKLTEKRPRLLLPKQMRTWTMILGGWLSRPRCHLLVSAGSPHSA